jgi:hypothetical protein
MIRVFPRRNKWTPVDALAFVGDPPLFRPEEQPVGVSVTFSWDIPEGERLARSWSDYYSDVQIGGPAFGDAGGEFVPGRFMKSGVVITSRGCPKKCPWCFVPVREGAIRELVITDGHIVQDNNLLACSPEHIKGVFEMLRRQKQAVIFSGGIDTTLLRPWHKELFDSIRLKELWCACDSAAGIPILERAAEILDGIPAYKRRCYVMIGFDGETLEMAEKRLKRVWELGFYPFCQLYQSDKIKVYSDEWKALNRFWSRPAIYKSRQVVEDL